MSAPRFSTLATAYNINGLVSLTFEPPPGAGDVLDPLWLRTNAVRITVEPVDAPTPAPPRSAEEIAREMVGDPNPTWHWARIFGAEFSSATPDGIKTVRRNVVSLIEQSRAGGAAAERERFAPLLRAARRWSATMSDAGGPAEEQMAADLELTEAVESLGATSSGTAPAGPPPRDPATRLRCACDHRDDNACSLREDYFGASEPCACDCHRPDAPKPPDLAGRIRALIQEYAGRWADADVSMSGEHADVLVWLRAALRDARDGRDVAQTIAILRRFGDGRVLYNQAADDLEAIVRECAPEAR